jgi:hypothetical protein
VFGALLAAVSMGALFGAVTVDQEHARTVEDQMYEAKVESQHIVPNEHKRLPPALPATAATAEPVLASPTDGLAPDRTAREPSDARTADPVRQE